MPQPRRAVVAAALAIAVSLPVGGAVLAYGSPSYPQLLILSGTVFPGDVLSTWSIHLTVGSSPMRLVGAWTAFDGKGWPMLYPEEGTVTGPFQGLCPKCGSLGGEVTPLCGPPQPFTQYNGTIDWELRPGAYTLHWAVCGSASQIRITDSVRTVPVS